MHGLDPVAKSGGGYRPKSIHLLILQVDQTWIQSFHLSKLYFIRSGIS